MTTEEMLQMLKIRRTSQRSLTRQLEHSLEELIFSLESGSVLPPERMIAEHLQISRVTVRNAMQKFYVNGDIVRHGRLGTMVAPRKQQLPRQINHLVLGMEEHCMEKYPLRFLLYEDLPPQRKFWETVVENYNQQTPVQPVELVWLNTNSDLRYIKDLLKEKSIDILMDSSMFHLNPETTFARLPQSLKNLIMSDGYLPNDLGLESDYRLPVNLAMPVILWNQELAEEIGLTGIREKLDQNQLLPLLLETAEKLPDHSCSGIRIWDYFNMFSMPEAQENPDLMRSVLNEIADAGKKSGKNIEKLFVLEQKYPLDNLEKFLQGKRIFLYTTVSHLQILDPPKFRHEFHVFPKKDKILCEGLALAIMKNCLSIPAAANFLKYLLSPEVQSVCAEIKRNLPVNKQAFYHFLQETYKLSRQESDDLIKKLFVRSKLNVDFEKLSVVLIYFIRDELNDLLHGKCTPAELIQIIQEKWEHIKNKDVEQKKFAI